MKVQTHSSLHNLLDNRMDNRTFKFYCEHAKNVPNSYCQLQKINGREVMIGGKKLINFNAINYLGLESHPEMIESAQQAIAKWGTLAGSARAAAELDLFQTLEKRLADWLGVDDVMVFTPDPTPPKEFCGAQVSADARISSSKAAEQCSLGGTCCVCLLECSFS